MTDRDLLGIMTAIIYTRNVNPDIKYSLDVAKELLELLPINNYQPYEPSTMEDRVDLVDWSFDTSRLNLR